jgi:drug/metabolite transporter (DMT)-like permease
MAPSVAAGPDRSTLGAFVGVVVFGGLNAIAVKQSVAELAPFWSASLRFLAAGVLFAVIVAATRRALPRGRSLAGALLYGSVGLAASFGFIYPALREVPAGTAIIFLALVPLMTFGLAIAQRQERFHVQGLLGALVALAGVAIVVADQLGVAVPIVPMASIIVGTAFIAESSIILKWIPRSDPFSTNAIAMLGGAAVLLVVSVVAAEAWTLPTAVPTWLALAYLVVLGSVVMFGLYLFALRRWTASAISYVTLLMPLVTVPVATLLLGERVSSSFLIGGAVALLGVYVGAFLHIRPRRSSATSLPECLPIDACAEPAPSGR